MGQIYSDKKEAEKLANGILSNFYVHNRNKHFIQAFSLVIYIVGTFMIALNAFEIQTLKSKFQEMSQGRNMLV
jgi:hypothetical protein